MPLIYEHGGIAWLYGRDESVLAGERPGGQTGSAAAILAQPWPPAALM